MFDRRRFLLAAGATGLAFGGLRRLLAQDALAVAGPLAARAARPRRGLAGAPGLGRLLPDFDGLLDLPAGFRYVAFSRTGETMDDGLLVPEMHDGMAAFPRPDGNVVLVRNHEMGAGTGGAFGEDNALLAEVPAGRLYDRGHGSSPCLGGTTTLVWDPREERLVSHHLSLAGTLRNCAGGPTPWGSWISCEESTEPARHPYERAHGWCFEVPASATGLVEPAPLTGLGRFNHEAAAVDPASGVVYLTEDRHDGLLYRFVPEETGRLAAGGRLQALVLPDGRGTNTRNWKREDEVAVGERLPVGWVDLDGIDAPGDDLRNRGREQGAAVFARGEGMWTGRGAIWFTATEGGHRRAGQVWRYVPSPAEGTGAESGSPGVLTLFIEPEDRDLVDMCDNITVAPWGDLVICEDGEGRDRVQGITPDGLVYPIAENGESDAEFTGATFSPDGRTLFVNVQVPGVTFAVTGPWERRLG